MHSQKQMFLETTLIYVINKISIRNFETKNY